MNYKYGKYKADGKTPFSKGEKNKSKTISKTDESSKQLIIDALGDNETHGFDIDSLYHTKDGWAVIEFLKCDTYSPHKSHPNKYWKKAWRKVISMWELTKKLDGKFFWITYEVPYNKFSVIEFKNIDINKGIIDETRIDTDFNGFRDWYIKLNNNSKTLW